MVDVVSGSHHHLKGRDHLTAGRTIPRHPEKSAGERRRQAGDTLNADTKPETKVSTCSLSVRLFKKRLVGLLNELTLNNGYIESINSLVVILR